MSDYGSSGKTGRASKKANGSGTGGKSTGSGSGTIVPSPGSRGTGGSALPSFTNPGNAGNRMQSPDGKTQYKAKKILMDKDQLARLNYNLRIAEVYVNNFQLELLSPHSGKLYENTVIPYKSSPDYTGIEIFEISRLVYNKDENVFEKLVSVYSALNSFGGIVAMILQSDGARTHLYLCTNTSGSSDVAARILENNLKGQFPGCITKKMSRGKVKTLLDGIGMSSGTYETKTVRSLSMIPSRREEERQHDKEFSAQGMEKFIDAMRDKTYTLVVLSQKVPGEASQQYIEGLESLYTALSPYVKETASFAESESDTVNYGFSTNVSSTISHAVSSSFGSSHTGSISRGNSSNHGSSYEGLFGGHNSWGWGSSFGTSESSGTTTGRSETDSSGEVEAMGEHEGSGRTTGQTKTLTINRDNLSVKNLLTKIDEHIKRINVSQTFGMWNSACYLIAEDIPTATIGTSSLASIYAGDSAAAPRAYYNQWDSTDKASRDKVLRYLQHLQHPLLELVLKVVEKDPDGHEVEKKLEEQQLTPGMMISGREIAILMGFPRKSVPGVAVDTMADFGRNIPDDWLMRVKRPISFGEIYHMGDSDKTKMTLNLDTFASHLFICGASGSGKSNTTYNLIEELRKNHIPFLVIEPVKGEYKTEFETFPNINIYTADESRFRQLKINPFEIQPGDTIQSHLSGLVESVTACWPLYGAMPGLLKLAFEEVYLEHGWDLEHTERLVDRGSKFPTFSDLAATMERVINESPYSNQTKSDYKGALLFRIQMLCSGYEGQIFDTTNGILDSRLFDETTIIDLSAIKSEETRSLLMAILIGRLRTYRALTSTGPNSRLKHVTILEEAHNLLKRCSQESSTDSSNIQGAAVAGISRSISELRSSGEGFMIIDQSPSKVDDSAIKNTAIKIVMRLPAKDDCEEMGTALSLNDEQIRELSRLDIGQAAVFHAGWTDTILAKMGRIWPGTYRSKGKKSELDVLTYTRIQGAILQNIYGHLNDEEPENIYDDCQDLLEELCDPVSGIRPLLPSSKQEQILDEVRSFCEQNEKLIKNGEIKALKGVFGKFTLQFLRLDSVFRIHKLKSIPSKMVVDDPVTGKSGLTREQIREAVSWEKSIRESIKKYLYMPSEWDPVKNYTWPANGEKAEFFWDIYMRILFAYARKYMDKSYGFMNAMGYLEENGFFKKR